MKVPLLLAAALLVAGCGSATSAPVATDDATSPEAPPTPSVTPTASPTASPALRSLDDFPLARGYPETNGDDGSPVEVTGASGVADLAFCGRPGWSPEGATDLVGTTYTGEAEDVRGRTLARYDEAEIAGVVDRLRAAVERCPEEEQGGTAQVYELVPADAGDESFLLTHRYRSDYGFDTGLEVTFVVRFGDLLLLSSEYGEGGGSASTITSSVREVVEGIEALVPELCEYAADPCSVREPAPVVAVGPDGVEDVALGMSAAEVQAAGLTVERQGPDGCRNAFREDPSGAYAVMAQVRAGVGVVAVWPTTYGNTPEDVGTGSSATEVRAAYPEATGGADRLTAPVPGRPDRAYRFDLDDGHLVTGVTLVLTGQACPG